LSELEEVVEDDAGAVGAAGVVVVVAAAGAALSAEPEAAGVEDPSPVAGVLVPFFDEE